MPVLVVSGYLDDYPAGALRRPNVVGTLRKPCDMNALRAKVREVLGAKGALRVRDLPGWPPRWIGSFRGLPSFPQGELGILRAVAPLAEGTLVLSIEFEGELATGLLPLPANLLDRVAQLLRQHTGHPIAEIRTLEVPE